MLVKYLENFSTLDHEKTPTLVISECSSLRLIPNLAFKEGVNMSSVFIYRDNAPSLFIPFESNNTSIQYIESLLDLSLSNHIIDLSGFMAVKTSEYEALTKAINSGMSRLPVNSHTGNKIIDNAIMYNCDSFADLIESKNNGGDF